METLTITRCVRRAGDRAGDTVVREYVGPGAARCAFDVGLFADASALVHRPSVLGDWNKTRLADMVTWASAAILVKYTGAGCNSCELARACKICKRVGAHFQLLKQAATPPLPSDTNQIIHLSA